MSESVQFEAAGLIVRLEVDQSPESPRQSRDNAGTLVMFDDRRGYYADPHGFDDLAKFCEWWQEISVIGGACLLLWDRGDGSLGSGDFTEPQAFGGFKWGCKFVGACYITADRAQQECFVDSKAATPCLEAEVEEFSQWRTGDVWGYRILDEAGTEYDSCWGYYGQDYCRESAIEAASAVSERMALDYCI